MSHHKTNNILQVNGPKSSSPSFKGIPGKTVIFFKKIAVTYVHSHYSIYKFTCKPSFLHQASFRSCKCNRNLHKRAFIHPLMTHLIIEVTTKLLN